MLSPKRIEQRIFFISLSMGFIFLLLELTMAVASRSQTVLMDAAYDGAELAVIAVSLLLTPLFYKPVSEKRPFGYYQCESLFIVIKGCMMLSVTIALMVNNVQIMLDGGRVIDSRQIAAFEMMLAAISLIVLLLLQYYGKRVESPSSKAEIYGWRVDLLSSAGVALAFWCAPLLHKIGLGGLAPYFDQMVALLLVVFVLPQPVKMIITAFRDLILFAPRSEVTEGIRASVEKHLAQLDYRLVFCEVTQTGRRLWVAATLSPLGDSISMPALRQMRDRLQAELRNEHNELELELIVE